MSEPDPTTWESLGFHVPKKPRVVVAMAHTVDYKPLGDIAAPIARRYCERWGYGFQYVADWGEDVNAFWQRRTDGDTMKIKFYQYLYERGEWDVFMWLDSDALIMNSDWEVDTILEAAGVTEDTHFLWSSDLNGPNSGVYFARFTPECHRYLSVSMNESIGMGWADQVGLIQKGVVEPFSRWVKCVPGRLFNAMDYGLYGWDRYAGPDANDYVEGAYIIHFAGLSQQTRLDLMREWAEKAK